MAESATGGIKVAPSMVWWQKKTGNKPYNKITKHSIEIPPPQKPFRIGEFLFLEIDLYKTNFFLVVPDKISYFSATFDTFWGSFGQFLGIF